MTNAELAIAGNPLPDYAGSFAIYTKKNGNMLLVFRLLGETEDQQIEMPAALVAIATQAQNGEGPFAGMASMMKGMF